MAYGRHDLFLLDPESVHLNHGAFGACPRPVFEVYQHWQRELERNPTALLGRGTIQVELRKARDALGHYLTAPADHLVYTPNPTTALNAVLRSLRLGPGDEILTSDQEYGALERAWSFVEAKTGARLVRHATDLPFDPQAWTESFLAAIGPRTRVIYLSHLASPTALILPLAGVVREAKARGLLAIVDGAHAPGHIPVDLSALGADIYSGACHKWLCAPKGSAFLYAAAEAQRWIEPLVVGWGWGPAPLAGLGDTDYVRWHEWTGTRDLAAYLATPAAISFGRDYVQPEARAACHRLALEAAHQLGSGQLAINPDRAFGQMIAIPLEPRDAGAVRAALDRERIVAPIVAWRGRHYVRVSIHIYNDGGDIERLRRVLVGDL